VVEAFVTGDRPSTKAALATLRKATGSTKVLVVLSSTDEINWLSLRNEPTVHLIESGQLNTYDVLVADEVVFTTDALDEFLGHGRDGTTERTERSEGHEGVRKAGRA
jgi:large subunit ribosomal protein L4